MLSMVEKKSPIYPCNVRVPCPRAVRAVHKRPPTHSTQPVPKKLVSGQQLFMTVMYRDAP